MNHESVPDDLNSGFVDYSVAIARGVAGLVPIVGPLLAEVVGVIIPRQRIDRVAKFAHELDLRLNSVKKSLLELKLNDDDFTDLIEEGFRQAARSLSDERRSYIASLVVNGLTSDDIDHSESKHLLRILNEINDIEVVWLRFYLVPTIGGDESFREANKNTLELVRAHYGSSQEVIDKETLQNSYKEHLSQLGLLEKRYRVDSKTELPKFDSFSGAMEVQGYRLTGLGKLLLHEIGLGKEDDTS